MLGKSTYAQPTVSVITPTYKRRMFLPMLIHLYQEQTYPKELRELIILDDSPQSNEDLIPKNDKSIRYLYQKDKMTLGEKRNKLNELARGDVIICFDDDDYHFPERIAYSVCSLNSQKTLIAGSSKINVYYSDIKEMHQYGPFSNSHGTNGTFAYRKEYVKKHQHDPTKNAQEEPSFTNNFSEKMAQLDPDKTIICISHSSNTFDKKKLLTQPNNTIGRKLNKMIKDKKYLEFLNTIHAKQQEQQPQPEQPQQQPEQQPQQPTEIYYSQNKQDEYLEKTIFKGFKNGFFIDVGAHDGKCYNNTLYFEEQHNWTGINIEPNKSVYDKLIINRPKCTNLNYAISNNDGFATFLCNDGSTEMLSGLKDTFDKRHMQRLNRENIIRGGTTKEIVVETKKMETICDEYNIKHIHLLSIDVEGAEFEVIKSINFEKNYIDVIVFENNFYDVSIPIINYLENKCYIKLKYENDIYMIHKDSQFYLL
jgi:FkbM family methyltransferase